MQKLHIVAFFLIILIMAVASIICSLCCFCLAKFICEKCRKQSTDIDFTTQALTTKNTVSNVDNQMEMETRATLPYNNIRNADAIEV